jgi:hypothetical protein
MDGTVDVRRDALHGNDQKYGTYLNKKRMEGWQPMDGMVDIHQDALLTSHPM